MRCGHADRLMSMELDRPLQPEQAERLAAHLAQCARCRAARSALHRAEGLFGAHPWTAPDADLPARVLAQLPHGRRAVIPVAPSWTRASSIVVAALVLVLLGVSGAVLLTGGALQYGAWPMVHESGWSAIAAGWDSLRDFVSALGAAAAAVWQMLRWPWAPIGGAVVLLVGAVWGWLWARSGRWRS